MSSTSLLGSNATSKSSSENLSRPNWAGYWQLTRLGRFPTGNILVFWSCVYSLAMAAYATNVPPRVLALNLLLFAIGSVLLHSAACVWNDFCDRDLDRLIERTKNRPLASGAVSTRGAIILLSILLAPLIGMLFLVNDWALYVGLFGIFPINFMYPLTKRWTNWPQAWLGLATNWGMLVAWISIPGSMNWQVVLPMFIGVCAQAIIYDSTYACVDREHDTAAGIKSAAVLFGVHIRGILSIFAGIFVLGFTLSGVANGQGPAYFIIACGGSALHFTWQLTTVDFEDGESCWKTFVSNGNIGYAVTAGILADYIQKLL